MTSQHFAVKLTWTWRHSTLLLNLLERDVTALCLLNLSPEFVRQQVSDLHCTCTKNKSMGTIKDLEKSLKTKMLNPNLWKSNFMLIIWVIKAYNWYFYVQSSCSMTCFFRVKHIELRDFSKSFASSALTRWWLIPKPKYIVNISN